MVRGPLRFKGLDGDARMIVSDFGSLQGPIVLWGGALGNRAALAALEREADRCGAGHVISTGDLAGYCAQGADCVAQIRSLGWPVIAGNVERNLAAGAMDCGCGFKDGSACDLLSNAWWAHADRTIAAADREWMADLPDIAVFSASGRRYAVIHGGFTDIARFIWPTTPDKVLREEITAIESAAGPIDGVIAGHSGLAFNRKIDGRHWINIGAIGLPPNDGAPGGTFATLSKGNLAVHRLDYDPSTTIKAMQEAGLTQGYDRALTTGLWPSQDILPEALRRPTRP